MQAKLTRIKINSFPFMHHVREVIHAIDAKHAHAVLMMHAFMLTMQYAMKLIHAVYLRLSCFSMHNVHYAS